MERQLRGQAPPGFHLLGTVPHPNILGAHPQHPRQRRPRIGPVRTRAFHHRPGSPLNSAKPPSAAYGLCSTFRPPWHTRPTSSNGQHDRRSTHRPNSTDNIPIRASAVDADLDLHRHRMVRSSRRAAVSIAACSPCCRSRFVGEQSATRLGIVVGSPRRLEFNLYWSVDIGPIRSGSKELVRRCSRATSSSP